MASALCQNDLKTNKQTKQKQNKNKKKNCFLSKAQNFVMFV